ncbi:MAG TPA: hypothetical protein VNZ03_31815 [Terriglobales bacterium]|jgi:hypothetical protein|nr:hypothetical protein [Terriglobales bacterium]
MNDLTRRFVSLIRKLRTDVRTAIDELSLIAQSCDPDYEEYSSDSNSDKPETNSETLAAIKALRVNQSSVDAQKYALDHRRYRLEWKSFRIAKWGGVFLIIYTLFTGMLVVYSIRSNQNSAKQLRDFENAEAGRLEVNFCLVPNDTHAAAFIVKNIGRSAAIDISISGGDGEGGIDSTYSRRIWESQLQPISPSPVGGILGPGEEHKYSVRLPDITQKMKDGTAYAFTFMNFGYNDIFRHQGSAQACIIFDAGAGGHWIDCPLEHTARATTPFTGMNGSFPGYCDTADKNLKLAYRPRIEIGGISTEQTLTPDKHFKSAVTVVNYTPITARNVKVFRFDDIIEKRQARKLPYEELTDQPKTIPANTVYTPAQNSGFGIVSRTKVSDDQWNGVKNGNLVGIISVLIVYEDDFSIPHHAEYCTFFEVPGNGPPCPWPVQND